LQARIVWWGDPSGGEVLPVAVAAAGGAAGGVQEASAAAVHSSSSIAFQLHTGPKYLTRYLRDMGSLAVTLERASCSGQALATCSVSLLALDIESPLETSCPLLAAQTTGTASTGGASDERSVVVGSLPILLELDYSTAAAGAQLASFELNEHLASCAQAADGLGSSAAAGAGAAAEAAAGSEDSAQPTEQAPTLGAPSVCSRLEQALRDR
jgi:hypothetical protein